ncbi:phosphoglycolate phosphatase [Thiothrix eikelboomii]|uniref:phosphoglycolate phosphatase n=1 Tax=Thiothrix eikelboomii TaxID=92487 RepID=UPI003BAF185D
MAQFQPKLVLIDLDGTLVDSVPDLSYSVDQTMLALGLPLRGEAAVRTWVGNGVQTLVERALTNTLDQPADPAAFEQALAIFMAIYAENTSQRSRLYPGVVEGLDFLQSCKALKVACVTNKAAQFTHKLLRDLGIFERFALIVSGDTLSEKKPHPLPLLYAAEQLGVEPADSLMLGDSKSDVKAARAAGFKIITVSYGYNHGEDIRDYHPDAVIDSFQELTTLIQCA